MVLITNAGGSIGWIARITAFHPSELLLMGGSENARLRSTGLVRSGCEAAGAAVRHRRCRRDHAALLLELKPDVVFRTGH